MSRFLLTTGFLLLTGGVLAQTTAPAPGRLGRTSAAAAPVRGRVTDAASGEALPGATIVFPDLRQATSADADGNFQFANLPKGRFLMQVRFVGFTTVARTVDTSTGQPLEVALTPAETEIGQVVVTGVSASTEMRRSPIPTSIIDQTRLRQTAATNAVDAIAHTPGLNQITTGAAISKPVIRGLSSNRVITLNNGAKQEGQQWGDEHGIEIDEFSIDRAEVIKGPGSLLYGSDGLAGVINFLPADPVEDGRIIGSVAANYQTNNYQQGYSLMNAGNLNGFNWQVRGSGKVAADYRNRYDGRVYNSGFRELNSNGYVGLNKSWGYSHFTYNSFNQILGLIEGERDSTSGRFLRTNGFGDTEIVTGRGFSGYGLDVPRQQINHLRIGTDNNFILGQHRLTVNVGWQQNLRREFGNPRYYYEQSLFFQLRTVDYAVRWFLPEMKGWNTTLGVSGMQQQNQNKGVEFLIPAYKLLDGGLFGVTKKSFGKLDLSGGLRYDIRHITADALYLNEDEEPVPAGQGEAKFTGFKSTFRNVSGSVGGAYNINDKWLIKANVARGFRAPNIAELGSNGVHEGTTRYEVGEPNLKAETSFQLDGGVSYTADHVSLSVDAFRNRISNYIFPRRLANAAGEDSIAVTGDRLFRYGQGDARLAGGEVSIDLHPHPLDWLHFENSFSMVRAIQFDQPEGQQYLPFIPADRLQSELRVNFRKVGNTRLHNLYARGGVEHNFTQNRIFSAFDTETRTPGYTLVNVGVGTEVTNSQDKTLFSLYLAVNNLFDVAYQNHLSRLKYTDVNNATGRVGVYNMGRTLSVKLVVPLSFK
ncbi:TonB-dependent receptor [Hymenobacter taeanensis]|uniref:TonB-dependent receptor n=1 Tax=Hymenobacter taeanensis TaxID=2735321 RepID=A0A6M6BFL3_9BACT|nr:MULTISPECIES: TonB-dependent receptor [Hymenobacter]QJX47056.1 TonB-dependent receptor [Hymenobacter taeanensis]UOQ80934.1 TonB-dependent receptor [Hymenobacter sp. 5414T-23]